MKRLVLLSLIAACAALFLGCEAGGDGNEAPIVVPIQDEDNQPTPAPEPEPAETDPEDALVPIAYNRTEQNLGASDDRNALILEAFLGPEGAAVDSYPAGLYVARGRYDLRRVINKHGGSPPLEIRLGFEGLTFFSDIRIETVSSDSPSGSFDIMIRTTQRRDAIAIISVGRDTDTGRSSYHSILVR